MKISAWSALTLASAAAPMLAACVPSVRPTAPDIATSPLGEPSPSTISLTVSIPIKPQLDAAEANLPSSRSASEYVEFFGTGGPSRRSCGIGCGYDVNRSPLTFAVRADQITTNLSLSYWLSCTKRIPCKAPPVNGSCGKKEPRRRATESFTTRIEVLPAWTVTATTRDDGVVAQDQCVMGKLGVVDLADKLAAGFGVLGKAIDGNLNQGFSQLRPEAEGAWMRLSSPIPVDADTWLELRPEKISISAIQTSGDKLQLTGVVSVRPTVAAGGRPPGASRPLPDASLDGKPGESFELFMPVKADYSTVEEALKDRLKIGAGGLHYPPTGAHYLVPTNVTLYGYGQKATFNLAFTGIAEGHVYLVGTPSFDADTNLLSFPDLDYSPETRKLAFESIQWVDLDAFIRDLRVRLVVDLSEPLDSAKSKLTQALNHRYGDVQLTGSIAKQSLVSVYVDPTKSRFVAYFSMMGSAAATVEGK